MPKFKKTFDLVPKTGFNLVPKLTKTSDLVVQSSVVCPMSIIDYPVNDLLSTVKAPFQRY